MVLLRVLLYVSCFFFALGYLYSDIICFEIMKKYTEATVTLGYFAKMIAIGTIQYKVILFSVSWVCLYGFGVYINIILKHTLAFIIILVILIICAANTMPSTGLRTSLLLAQNSMFTFKRKGLIHSIPDQPPVNQDYSQKNYLYYTSTPSNNDFNQHEQMLNMIINANQR